jgi:hypothetical protein
MYVRRLRTDVLILHISCVFFTLRSYVRTYILYVVDDSTTVLRRGLDYVEYVILRLLSLVSTYSYVDFISHTHSDLSSDGRHIITYLHAYIRRSLGT